MGLKFIDTSCTMWKLFIYDGLRP